jgi:hypothetical protein
MSKQVMNALRLASGEETEKQHHPLTGLAISVRYKIIITMHNSNKEENSNGKTMTTTTSATTTATKQQQPCPKCWVSSHCHMPGAPHMSPR